MSNRINCVLLQWSSLGGLYAGALICTYFAFTGRMRLGVAAWGVAVAWAVISAILYIAAWNAGRFEGWQKLDEDRRRRYQR